MSVARNQLSVGLMAGSLALLVVGLNLYANFLFTDFWQHPVVIKTKLGVMAYEVLGAALFSMLFMLPALVLSKIGAQRAALISLVLGLAPSTVLLLGGWSFYALFEKFIGLYLFQMVKHDGAQLLEIAGTMPSSYDSRLVLLLLAMLVGAFTTVVLARSRSTVLNACASTALAALLLACVPAASTWNRPYAQAVTGDADFDRSVNRIHSAEFDNLQRKTGPFVSLIENAVNLALIDTGLENVTLPPNALRKRQTIESVDPDEIDDPRHVIVFLVESLRPDMLEAFGSTDDVMPAVNALSSGGYAFTNMWAQASHSNYADIATVSGQYALRSPNIHFFEKEPHYPRSRPWDVLKARGYSTGVFSSGNEDWGLMSNYMEAPSLDVFSHVGTDANPRSRSLSRSNPGIEFRIGEENTISLGFEDFMYRKSDSISGRPDRETIEDAVVWIDSLKEGQPLFAYFNLQASHYPFNAVPDDMQRRFLTGTDLDSERLKRGETRGQPIELVRAAYMDSLNHVDQNIARVVDTMKATGRHEDTLYVVAADTSILLSDNFLGNGGDLLPEVLHIPALILDPRMDTLTTDDQLAAQIDLLPTVLSFAGAAPHPASQGIDLLDSQRAPNPDRVVYSVAQTPASHQYAAIRGDWMLVHDFDSADNVLRPLDTTSPAKPDLNASQRKELARSLQTWVNWQLAYYEQPGLQQRFFPPLFDLNIPATVVSDTSVEP